MTDRLTQIIATRIAAVIFVFCLFGCTCANAQVGGFFFLPPRFLPTHDDCGWKKHEEPKEDNQSIELASSAISKIFNSNHESAEASLPSKFSMNGLGHYFLQTRYPIQGFRVLPNKLHLTLDRSLVDDDGTPLFDWKCTTTGLGYTL